MKNLPPLNLIYSERDNSELLQLLMTPLVKVEHPYGDYCNVLVKKKKVLKAYSSKAHRDNGYHWQQVSSKYRLGPLVGEKFDIWTPEGRYWGYVSEKAKCFLHGYEYAEAVDYLKKKFNEYDIPFVDLDKPENIGTIGENTVCVDFNLFGGNAWIEHWEDK